MNYNSNDSKNQTEDRAKILYEKALYYKTEDPEVSLSLARKVLEAICKNLYLQADLKTQEKDIEKMTLYPLLNELERMELIPPHIRMHLNTIKCFGDFSSHYQIKLNEVITPDYVEPIFQALQFVYNWYSSECCSSDTTKQALFNDDVDLRIISETPKKPFISLQVRVTPNKIVIDSTFEIRLLWNNNSGVKAIDLNWAFEYDTEAFKLKNSELVDCSREGLANGDVWEVKIVLETTNMGEQILLVKDINWKDEQGNQYALASYSIPVEIEFGWTSSMVGRDQEFASLKKVVDKAKNWQGGLIAIKGEAGVGKSYLLEKIENYARDKEFHVLKESCELLNETWAFHPFKRMFEAYFSLLRVKGAKEKSAQMHSGIIDLNIELKPYASILTQFFVGESEGEQSTKIQLSPQDLRGQFLFAAGQLFEAMSSKQPTLLIIEDLQHADTGTIDLLQYLAKRAKDCPLLIMLAIRSEDLISSRSDEPHPLERALREIIVSRQGEIIDLAPLSFDNCASLIDYIFQESLFPPGFASIIFEETEGNPLYIHEILKSLVEREVIVRQHCGRWELSREIDDLDIPDTIEQVIKTRLELVSKDSFLDLQKASVIGREFAYKLLQQLSNREEDILINYLEEFTDHRIIETLDRYGDIYRFCHGKIKEVVYKEIQAIRRRKLHIQAAELLEVIYQDQLIEFSSIISQHYSLGGNYDRAVKYLMMSGCKNAKVYANKEALSNYQEALVLNAKRIQSIETLKVEQELNFKIALVYREINDYSEANKYYKLALAITERINDQVSAAEIMNKQAETFAIRGEYEQAEDIYKKCLVLAEKLKLSELHLQLYNDFADLYWWKCQGLLFEGKTDEAANYMETIIDYTTKARKISEEIGDQESLVRSIKNIGNYYYLRGDNLKALEQFELCVELTEGHDLLSQKYVYEMVGRVYRLTGSFDKALDAYQKYLNWSLQIGAQWAQLKAYQVMGLVNLELQKYDEALTWLNKSLELNKVVLGYHEQIETLIVKGKTLELMGEMDKGFTCYAEALQVRGKEVELDNPELILKNVGIEMYSRQELEQAKYFIQRYLDYNPNLTKEEEELVKEIMQ